MRALYTIYVGSQVLNQSRVLSENSVPDMEERVHEEGMCGGIAVCISYGSDTDKDAALCG